MWATWATFLVVMLFALGGTLVWSFSKLPPVESIAIAVIILLAALCLVQGVAIFFDAKQSRKEQIFRNWVTIILLALAFAATLAQTHIFNETLIDSNRAWLAISHVDFLRQPDSDGSGPLVMVHYRNVGRFPALDVKTGGTWLVIPAEPITRPQEMPQSPAWPVIDAQVREQCSRSQPFAGGATVFPLESAEQNYQLSEPDPMPDIKMVANAKNLLIVAPGCITYRTFNEVHHTGFCRYGTNVRSGKWEFLNCPAANFAE